MTWPIVDVIIPAHNEGKCIDIVLHSLEKAKSQGLIRNIIIVNDGSTDDTEKIGKRLGGIVLNISQNRGKAAAVAHGIFSMARDPPEMAMILDADLNSFRSAEVYQLIKGLIDHPRATMAIGDVRRGGFGIFNEYSGQRIMRFSFFGPLLAHNKKWLDYFGLALSRDKKRVFFKRRIGYGLEEALNILSNRSRPIRVNTHFESSRTTHARPIRSIFDEIFIPSTIAEERMKKAREIKQTRGRGRIRKME